MSAANRMPSFLATMKWEGGDTLSLDRNDAGNWSGGKVGVGSLMGSKYGVSAPVAARNGLSVASITADQALKIFVEGYWSPCGCDGLAVGFDHCVSDEAYNSGPGSARALYARGGFTLKSEPAGAIKAFSDLRLSFLHGLKSWTRYGAGWARRVGGVEAESLRMAMSAVDIPKSEQETKIQAHADDVKSASVKHVAKAGGAVVAAPTVHAVTGGSHVVFELIVAALIIAAVAFVVKSILQSQRAAGIAAAPK